MRIALCEQALGWYYHLEGTLHFPFTARCIARRATSPLEVGDEVEVVGMPAEEECEHDMLVLIRWRPHELAVLSLPTSFSPKMAKVESM